MPTISLCMLVKNGRELFENCLTSIAPYVDEIIVVVDGESEDGCDDVARSFGAKVFYREMDEDFAAQRNYSFEQATGDWLFWMDSDDVIPQECAERLPRLVESADEDGVEVYLFDYHYAFNDAGEVTTVLKRERLMRASLPWRWKYPIHEVCVCEKEDGSQPTAFFESGIWIVHRKHEVKEQYRDPGRNMRFIERYMPEYEAVQDGRMLFYAGNECMAAGQYEKAFHYYDQLLEIDDEWKEQKALAAIRSASMLFLQEDYEKAKQRCYTAIDIDERWADSYCLLGDIAMVSKEWEKAIHFYNIAIGMPLPVDTVLLPYDPHKYTTYPLYKKHVALSEMERYDDALEVLKALIEEYDPDDQRLKAKAMDLAELAARTRRRGLNGISIIQGNLQPSHPSFVRHAALEAGLRAAGMDVNIITDPGLVPTGGKIAVVLDSSARINDESIANIKKAHTDIVIDFCGSENDLSNDETISMLRNATAVTTNSPFMLERLRAVNRNSTYIPDPTLVTTPSKKRDMDDTVRVFMASTDEEMATLTILPLLQRVAESEGKKLEFKIVGSTGMATRMFDGESFRELAEWADIGVAYFPRDDHWRGAEFVTSMMGAGLPIIASGNSATNSIVDHNDSGIICNYHWEWETEFKTLLSRSDVRRRLGVLLCHWVRSTRNLALLPHRRNWFRTTSVGLSLHIHRWLLSLLNLWNLRLLNLRLLDHWDLTTLSHLGKLLR
jgi:glycosyltransferase involved in cell wall biosynthesis